MTGEDGRIPVPQLDPEGKTEGPYIIQVSAADVADLLSLVEGTNITFTTDGSAIAINSTAGADPAFGAFKGTWQATPDELVWEQDFDVDLSPFTGPGARTTMASAVGTSKPGGYNYVDQGSATPAISGSTNIGTLDLSTLPALSGRTPTRVKWWNGQKAVGNYSSGRSVLFQVERGGVVGYTRTLTPVGFVTVTDAWSENECTVAAGNVVNWRITGSSTGPVPTGTFAFTAVRVYAVPVGWSGYNTNDYVIYQGQLYVSTTDSNGSTPGASGATWNLVPIYATAKTPNAQTGTAYTLVADDADKTVTMNNAAASTLTVPPNSAVAFPIGTSLTVAQIGAGLLTLAAGAGVTISGLPIVMAQNRGVRLVKTATDTWIAFPFAVPSSAVAPNAQTGTTYTLALADSLRPVTLTNAAAITLTVPTNATVPLPVGTRITVLQGGAGGVTFSPAAGVTINNNAALAGQWSRADLLKTGTDTWVLLPFVVVPTSWTSWTPTLNNFTGTINFARYKSDGKTCRVQVAITLDATPTGRMEVTAPLPFATGFPTGNAGPVGTCIANDVGTARRLGASFFLAGSIFVFGSDSDNSFWGISLPHAWVAGDTIGFNAEYELA